MTNNGGSKQNSKVSERKACDHIETELSTHMKKEKEEPSVVRSKRMTDSILDLRNPT